MKERVILWGKPATTKSISLKEEKLIELCAKVPFDDRINQNAEIKDIDPALIRSFLDETNSSISKSDINIETFKSLRIVTAYHDKFKPRNVAILLFNSKPHEYLNGCYFEVVQFSDLVGGDVIEEKQFKGPLDRQISEVINYL